MLCFKMNGLYSAFCHCLLQFKLLNKICDFSKYELGCIAVIQNQRQTKGQYVCNTMWQGDTSLYNASLYNVIGNLETKI